MAQISLIIFLAFAASTSALDNGLALTPPMGWLAWERFRCNTDCINDPENCISEKLFMKMADIMESEGYLDAGYDLVSLDDCWLNRTRDSDGTLQPDHSRFPSGISALADYIHKKNMKFGIYEDYGTHTCAGYPGILGHLEKDANTFAEWGMDYLKLDGCYADPKTYDQGYPEMGFYLNQTGRPIIYSCSWPVYQSYSHMKPNWTAIVETCNLWRVGGDIQDSWKSVKAAIDQYGRMQDVFAPLAGPGHWNDPDMLIIGNYGLSFGQSRTQMAMWAIMAAPLLMSVDLRAIKPDYKAILLNKDIIAVNQDSLGIQGRRVVENGDGQVANGIEIWTRPINPIKNDEYSFAVGMLNNNVYGEPTKFSVSFEQLGLKNKQGYVCTDLYDNVSYGKILPETKKQYSVNPSGSILMLRCEIVDEENSNK